MRKALVHPLCTQAFCVLAYRGGRGERPENTLAALVHSRSVGAVPEIDLDVTSDHHVVAFHGPRLSGPTDGRGELRSTKYEMIGKLDAGYGFTDSNGNHPYRGRGIHVPLLEEILALDDGPLVFDLHFDSVKALQEVVRIVSACDAVERVCLVSIVDGVRDALGALGQEWLVAADSRSIRRRVYAERLRLDRYLPKTERLFFVPEYFGRTQILTPRFIETAKVNGERIMVLEAHTVDAARRAQLLGAHGVFTDFPERMLNGLIGMHAVTQHSVRTGSGST